MKVSVCRYIRDGLHSCLPGDVSLPEITAAGGVLFHSPVGVLAVLPDSGEDVHEVICWLEEYFRGMRPEWLPELHLDGTPFQKRVWELLKGIPYGQTTSYGALAARFSTIDSDGTVHRMSAQAIGQAVGANPCCILIPCHRVIASSGAIGGYAYGSEIKKKLLVFESETTTFGNNLISFNK